MIDAAAGQFIDLHAFGQWARRQDRLPHWRSIRDNLPQLVAQDPRERRRLFITHRWDDQEHPDPSGWQLRTIRAIASDYRFREKRPCFWFDYMSLPQKPRVGKEGTIFSEGLKRIRRTVGDCDNITLISQTGSSLEEDLDAALKRGWIVFELLIARSHMKIPLPFYQAGPIPRTRYGADQQHRWDAVVADIATQIPFDSAKLIHAWFSRRGITCTNGSDLEELSEQLHKQLTEKHQPEPKFKIVFDKDMRLTQDELNCLEIRDSSRLSGCYPHVFLSKLEPNPPGWIVRLARRPPMPPLNEWVQCVPEEGARRLIAAATMTSPMYPGIMFEFDARMSRMRAILAPP